LGNKKLKIRLLEKNSTEHTLQPYKVRANLFNEMGIQFVDETATSYDLTFVTHNKFCNKKISLEESTERGLEFLSTIKGPYILVDGQDSSSLIGTFDIFKQSDAICMLKYVLLADKSLYKQEWINGRYYWGKSDVSSNNYSVPEFDDYQDRILLAGTNWLGTLGPIQWQDYRNIPKLIDINGMFGYPHPPCEEHDLKPSQDHYYNEYRKPLVDRLNNLPYIVAKLYNGNRVDHRLWALYNVHSKILLSPYGYGAYGAPRDITAAQFGSILIKERIDWIDTIPNIYEENETYIACNPDFSDIEEKIDYVMSNYDSLIDKFVTNLREKYDQLYDPYNLPVYTAKVLNNFGVVEYE
jgi:hypothetical protein